MTDRIKGYLVTLEGDFRDDDAEHIQSAIQMIKGVYKVKHPLGTHFYSLSVSLLKREVGSMEVLEASNEYCFNNCSTCTFK